MLDRFGQKRTSHNWQLGRLGVVQWVFIWLEHEYDKINCTYRGGDKTLDQHDAMTDGKFQRPITTALQHPHLHK